MQGAAGTGGRDGEEIVSPICLTLAEPPHPLWVGVSCVLNASG